MPPLTARRRGGKNPSHIAIIGAGIAGLATAHCMRQRGFEGRLSIFDKGREPGGRLWSGRPGCDLLVVEYGAGRLHAGRHGRLVTLCEELQLPMVPFDYPVQFTSDHSGTDPAPGELLEEHMDQRVPTGLQAPLLRWNFWEHGISFFRRAAETSSAAQFAQVAPGVLICSDIHTKHPGWVEGSLIRAEATATQLLSTQSAGRANRRDMRYEDAAPSTGMRRPQWAH
ncbi:FAD/NAD(P)-binding protein [Variovorax sp.]|uniref:FAD/NAD(P)-binding protein n=1 Tax=Variovorax sp. TaxID=1871043 RepID=UPI002D718279|nr:FAD/NAD(P)-binding protein [Variovorax sp.]HYP85297.1 FAD/NAD(P)-binding protein [Variovorax sp.]